MFLQEASHTRPFGGLGLNSFRGRLSQTFRSGLLARVSGGASGWLGSARSRIPTQSRGRPVAIEGLRLNREVFKAAGVSVADSQVGQPKASRTALSRQWTCEMSRGLFSAGSWMRT